MPGPWLEHIGSFLFSGSLILVCSPLFIFESFQPIFHDLMLLFHFSHIVVVVQHHDAIVMDSPLSAERGKLNCAEDFLLHGSSIVQLVGPHDFGGVGKLIYVGQLLRCALGWAHYLPLLLRFHHRQLRLGLIRGISDGIGLKGPLLVLAPIGNSCILRDFTRGSVVYK